MAEAPFAPPFVGRQNERDAYQQLLRAARDPWMLLVSGQGGNGKSRLLRQLQEETPADVYVGLLDFANEYLRVEPLQVAEELARLLHPLASETSFQAFWQEYRTGRDRLSQMSVSLRQEVTVGAGAQAQGISQSITTDGAIREMQRQVVRQVVRMVTTALLDLAGGIGQRHVVLLLDTCEWFHEPASQEVGIWLKDTLPRLRAALGGGLRVVATGREGLERLFPFEGTAPLRLNLLPFPELEDYLRQTGMQDASVRQAVFEMTRGHPLCASIVAQIWRERPFGDVDLPAFEGEFSDQAVTSWVLERVLKRLQPPYDDLTRYGVLLRSFDLPLLRKVFPEWVDAGDQVFQRLIGYAFILRLTNRRHAFHDLLRQVQASYVRRQLPERWQQYHARALQFWELQREEVFGKQLRPPDYFYHRLALDEAAGTKEWEDALLEAGTVGERDYWGRLLQVAHDATLVPGVNLQAKRAYHQGIFFLNKAQWDAALASCGQALALFHQLGDCGREADTRVGIGDIWKIRGDYGMALENYQQALDLYRQVGDRPGEADAFRAIGQIQGLRDGPVAALESLQQALTLFRQAGKRIGEANVLCVIGSEQMVYEGLDAALESYQQALALFRQVGYRRGEADALHSIGSVHMASMKFDAALESYQQALALFRQVGFLPGEAQTLQDIGAVQMASMKFDAALESYQQALALFRQVGFLPGEAGTLILIGGVYAIREELDAALESYQQALALFRQVGVHDGEATTLSLIGKTQQDREELDAALESFQLASTLYRQTGNRHGEAQSCIQQGEIAHLQGNFWQALAFQTQAYQLFQQLQNSSYQAIALYHRSSTYEAIQQQQLAIQDVETALNLTRDTQHPVIDLLQQRLDELLGGAG